MSILIDKHTKVICQGPASRVRFHPSRPSPGNLVGGVTPAGAASSRGPVFDTVHDAVAEDRR